MEIYEAMSTMRSVRLFTDEPVTEEQLNQVLRMAQFAPNGSNEQRYRFIVVRDPEQRAKIGHIYRDGITKAMGVNSIEEAESLADKAGIMRREVVALAKNLATVPPVIIFAGGTGNWQSEPAASVFPAVQNLCLAAWAMGLGTIITTAWQRDEDAVRKVLGVPKDVYLGALIPLGHPARKYGPPKRGPVDEIIVRDRWS